MLLKEMKDKCLASINSMDMTDIYAFGIYVSTNTFFHPHPTFYLCYNTFSHLDKKINLNIAPEIAKWEYKHWYCQNLLSFGEQEEFGMMRQWVLNIPLNTLSHTQEEKRRFYNLMIELSNHLHDECVELYEKAIIIFGPEEPLFYRKVNTFANNASQIKEYIDYLSGITDQY